MKKVFVILMSIASIFVSSPAHAYDDGGDRYGQREGCGEQGGGCNNERDENYSGAGCKYVCPSFDKSPVHDAFNFSPFVCMPGATCYEDGGKRKNQDQPPSQQPTAEPNPACLITVPYHCDPHPGGK